MGSKVTGIAVLLMIAMSVVAEAQLQPFEPIPPPPSPHPPSFVKCGAKCAAGCVGLRFPPLIGLCLGLCLVRCGHAPSAKVYSCTNGCASNMLTNTMSTLNSDIGGTDKDLDFVVDKVSGFVDSCYQTCSENERL